MFGQQSEILQHYNLLWGVSVQKERKRKTVEQGNIKE